MSLQTLPMRDFLIHMNYNNVKKQFSYQYYPTDQLSNVLQHMSHGNHLCLNDFSTLHLNFCSLTKNYDHLREYLSTIKYSFLVAAFLETWLNDDITCLYPWTHFNAVNSHRKKNKVGGGISIYVPIYIQFIEKVQSII